MPVEFADKRKRAFDMMVASKQCRIYRTDTTEFVNLSGTGFTKNIKESWLGTLTQANTMLDRLRIQGKDVDGFSIIQRGKFNDD